uniref:ParB/Sulfiredoxin domain-containing protein n=1 Tax=viral metagenome TaxID=1070528 RepID=A0A6C0KVD3_9ZZZZ
MSKRKLRIAHVEEKEKSLASLLESYREQEYLPNYVFSDLLHVSFPNATITHSYSGQHHMIKMPIRDLLQAPISNWQYNRPADRARSEDIAHFIVSSKKPVDTLIYVSFNNKKQSYDVVDGIHRYTALKIVEERSKHMDLISDEFGEDMTWLFNSVIFINVRLNSPEEELIGLFKSLNKSNPIPELYVRDLVKDKRECIEMLTIKWQNQYKAHFSTTNKPQRPNINRDRFMDLLDAVYDKYHVTEETKDKLEQKIVQANLNISQNVPKKLPTSIQDKCKMTGCWLFVYTCDELVKMV